MKYFAQTNNLGFAYFSKNDVESFNKWYSDEEILNILNIPDSLVKYTKKNLRNTVDYQSHNQKSFSVFYLETDTLIGECDISISRFFKYAEIGLIIGLPEYWNRGFGYEIMTFILDYGFNNEDLNSIHLHTYETNARAINLFKRVGFSNIFPNRGVICRNGELINFLYMDILKSEWIEKKDGLKFEKKEDLTICFKNR